MCGLRLLLSALFFLLAFEPHIMLLYAQEGIDHTETSTEASNLIPSTEPYSHSDSKYTTRNTDTVTVTEPVRITSFAPSTQAVMTTPLQESQQSQTETQPATTQSKEPPSTAMPYVITTTTQETTTLVSTVHLQVTTQPHTEIRTLEDTTVMIITSPAPQAIHTPSEALPTTVATTTVATTVATTTVPSTTVPSTTVPTTVATTTVPTTVSEAVFKLTTSTKQPAETTPSTMETTNPTEVLNIDDHTDSTIPDKENTEDFITSTFPISDTTPSVGNTSLIAIEIRETNSENNENGASSKWFIIVIFAVAIVFITTVFCIIIFVKRRKRHGTQHFNHGYMNGRSQRSKKKKGEDDAWAGPVNLDGEKADGGENPEDGGQTDDKKADGTDVVLSTFAALEENGGIGRPGSMEVQKWEEKEPLLYIDEDAKEEGKQKQTEEVEKTMEVEQKEEENVQRETEIKEKELNGGEAFCLTTAV